MEQDYYQMLSQMLNAGYNPYLPQYGQTQPAELYELSQPQQQQSGGGVDINSAMNIYDMFAGGGATAGGAGTAGYGGFDYGVASSPAAGGGTWYGPFAEGGIAGSGGTAGGSAAGGAGSSGFGSTIAAAGPWAALAAAIIANEYGATEAGRRREGSDYYKDLFSGKVLEQDAPYYSQKIFGKDDKYGFGKDMEAGAELATLDFSNFWDKAKEGTLGKILGIFS